MSGSATLCDFIKSSGFIVQKLRVLLLRRQNFILTKKKITATAWCWLAVLAALLGQQPFGCNDDAWLVLAAETGHSSLIRIVRDTAADALPTHVVVSPDLGHRVDAIGFNVRDNFIYGLDVESHSLLRIGADGLVEDLGVPQNLDTGLEYHAGAIKPEGGRWFIIGRQPEGKDLRLYSLQLEPPYYAGFVSVVSDEPVQMGDIAYDPVFGALLAFDEVAGRVIHLSSGGAVSTYPFENQPQLQSLGGLYFDASGKLLGFGGSKGNENKLFLFNRFSGEVGQAWPLPGGVRSDACSCPYRLRLRKLVAPQRVLPCSEVRVTYRFENSAGISYGKLRLEDEFPPGFEITGVVHQPGFGEQISGVGSNLLQVDMLDVVLGVDSLVIRVNVGDFAGTAASQALLFPLPTGLGEEIPSDNPATGFYPDATPIEVVTDALLASDTVFKCPGGQLALQAAAGAMSYLWSNGHHTATTVVTQAGVYWVEAQGACGSYRDTFQVLDSPPLQVELGDDLTLSFGTQSTLHVQTNAQQPTYLWQSDSIKLSCYTCAAPQFTASRGGRVMLSIRDAFGCTASDSLRVLVLPERRVYFPTAFSPNGDGINDYFLAYGKGNFDYRNFSIYNRWGELVFAKKKGVINKVEDGWDGRFKGERAAPGLYTFQLTVQFAEGEEKEFHGRMYLVK